MTALLDFGADLGKRDGLWRSALHELARLGRDSSRLDTVCLVSLVRLERSRRIEVLNMLASGSIDGSSDSEADQRTLGEMVSRFQAWHLLPTLVNAGLDLHWSPVKERAGAVLQKVVRFGTFSTCNVSKAAPPLEHSLRIHRRL